MYFVLGFGLVFAVTLGVVMVVTIRPTGARSRRSQAVAGFNAFWGVLTVFYFAPAGLLAALMGLEQSMGGAVAIALVSLDGFALGIALIVAARRLLKHTYGGVIGVAWWSLVHHAAVLLAFVLAMEAFDDLALYTTIPCAMGAALAAGLIRRVQRDRATEPLTEPA